MVHPHLLQVCFPRLVVSPVCRHHERDARCEAVHLPDDREQRPRDEGAAHGQGDGEAPGGSGGLCGGVWRSRWGGLNRL